VRKTLTTYGMGNTSKETTEYKIKLTPAVKKRWEKVALYLGFTYNGQGSISLMMESLGQRLPNAVDTQSGECFNEES